MCYAANYFVLALLNFERLIIKLGYGIGAFWCGQGMCNVVHFCLVFD